MSDFEVGEIVVCVKSGADAPNPWHAANPLTVGAEYTILEIARYRHVSGADMGMGYAVDRSGRYWHGDCFRRKGKPTDITFAYEILRKVNAKNTKRRKRERAAHVNCRCITC
jgi:hypothetical protein